MGDFNTSKDIPDLTSTAANYKLLNQPGRPASAEIEPAPAAAQKKIEVKISPEVTLQLYVPKGFEALKEDDPLFAAMQSSGIAMCFMDSTRHKALLFSVHDLPRGQTGADLVTSLIQDYIEIGTVARSEYKLPEAAAVPIMTLDLKRGSDGLSASQGNLVVGKNFFKTVQVVTFGEAGKGGKAVLLEASFTSNKDTGDYSRFSEETTPFLTESRYIVSGKK